MMKHILEGWARYRASAAFIVRACNSHPDLCAVLEAMVLAEVEYMTINNLGDPEKQHNIKWARTVLAKARGDTP
jgi:hypothetical protein